MWFCDTTTSMVMDYTCVVRQSGIESFEQWWQKHKRYMMVR